MRKTKRSPFSERPGFAKEMGERGGQIVKERYGTEYYREIGKKGGASMKARQDPNYYSKIGKVGGKRRAENAKARAEESAKDNQ